MATKLMATGISSFCLDFSPPTLITRYKISDLFWNRMNCGIGTRLNLYIPNARRQKLWSGGQGSLGHSGFGESQSQEPTGAECEEWLPSPPTQWNLIHQGSLLPTGTGKIRNCPSEVASEDEHLTYSHPQSICNKGDHTSSKLFPRAT